MSTHLEDVLSKNVSELRMPVRIAYCFMNEGIDTIGDLVQRTQADMLRISNFSHTSLMTVNHTLSLMGLSLGMGVRAADQQKIKKMPKLVADRVLYTIAEVARETGLGERAIRDSIARGEIPSKRFGRLIKVPAWWINEQRNGPARSQA